MLIAVIGGKLQGVEAVYLAKKAGFKTLVIDKNPDAPATGLCDEFLEFEFASAESMFENPVPENCPQIDLILPAIEDDKVLAAVKLWAEIKDIPLAFDFNAYKLSSSKLKSDVLFRKMNLPMPMLWPDCGFPVVTKPDQASGSQGVKIIHDARTLSSIFPAGVPDGMVMQEYISGPAYSIEVVGSPGNYKALQVTDLEMDKIYDCKRVIAPTKLHTRQIHRFEHMAIAIAEKINLTGIMDVEVVLNQNKLKLLEIDARLPSQTPITVYHSTGINMVEMLVNLFLNKKMPGPGKKQEQSVIVEHIRVNGNYLEVMGEHIMAHGPLTRQLDFFGANEAITSYAPGKKQWVATLILTGASMDEVLKKKKNCHDLIRINEGQIK